MRVFKYEILSKIYGIDEKLMISISPKIILNYCIEEVVEGIYNEGSSYEFYYDIFDILYLHKSSIINCLKKAINKGYIFFNKDILKDFEISCNNHNITQFFNSIEKDDLDAFFRICFIEIETFIEICDEVHNSLEEESLILTKAEYDKVFISELKDSLKGLFNGVNI